LSGHPQEAKSLHARILSGSVVLLLGSGLLAGINFAYNVSVARFLGPTGFGHATAVYTLLTLISAVTLSFQIVPAKVVAKQSTPEAKGAAYRDFHRAAWGCGILVALVLALFRSQIANFLKLPSPLLVVLIGIGCAFYVPLGSRRGYIQGAYGFRALSMSLVLEGATRLGGSLLAIALGYGVTGVIAANAAAIAIAYFATAPKLPPPVPNQLRLSQALRESMQAITFFAGQVLINNCDIVLVKHFFTPKLAGLYAVVAMVGRVIFAFSSAVVNSMFPLVAGTRDEERKDVKVLATPLLLVLGIGGTIALALRLAPPALWTVFFGSSFGIDGSYSLSYLLSLYALTTVIYALSVVMITYEMSYKIANTSWIQLAFAGVVVAGICVFHGSLREVILVQLVLMLALLGFVASPFLRNTGIFRRPVGLPRSGRPVRLIRRTTEDEAIAEYLKGEFDRPMFREYHASMGDIVRKPNLEVASENSMRRALLFLRQFSMWKELPTDTQWYEVEIREEDLERIRAFPRAQWPSLSPKSLSIVDIVDALKKRQADKGGLEAKIASIAKHLEQSDSDPGAVLLIGLNETESFTILDGNHRLVASLLASPHQIHRLRFLCGLSPRMTECCWYATNLGTLYHYAKNIVKHLTRDHEAELARLLQRAG
jgi:O-antigen/teichoic acid export membrane protein